MKKTNYQITAVFCFLVISFFSFNVAKAAEQADQSQLIQNSTFGVYEGDCLTQGIEPTADNITSIDLKAFGNNLFPEFPMVVRVGISTSQGGSNQSDYISSGDFDVITIPFANSTHNFDIPDIALTPGSQNYWIKVCYIDDVSPYSRTLIFGNSNTNPYPSGFVTAQLTDYPGIDTYFVTYFELPPPPPPPQATASSTTILLGNAIGNSSIDLVKSFFSNWYAWLLVISLILYLVSKFASFRVVK